MRRVSLTHCTGLAVAFCMILLAECKICLLSNTILSSKIVKKEEENMSGPLKKLKRIGKAI